MQILGEKKPFISYVDNHPVKVNYVSFSSQEPYIVKHNCLELKSNPTTDTPNNVEIPGTNIFIPQKV